MRQFFQKLQRKSMRFTALFLLLASGLLGEALKITPQEAEAIGIEGYIYGYPLVTMDFTREVMTNVSEAEALKAPMGQFANIRTYPDAAFRMITAPNADTLYSTAWLNLTKEPWILHIPDEEGRYFLMPMLSGWTDVFAVPGLRTTGSKAGDFVITGPDWKGTLPSSVTELKSPTNLVWILGRTYSTGTPEDYAAVHKIQDEYGLKPLSSVGQPYTPSKGTVADKIDMRTAVRDQVNKLDAVDFFNRLGLLMKENPPAKADAPILAKLAKIGFVPGQPFDLIKLDPIVAKCMENVPELAQKKIMGHFEKGTVNVNGWRYPRETGEYGTDYLNRALVTAIGLGANRMEDAIYPLAKADSDNQPLNGSGNYVIHFNKGELPPVRGFWSITMYSPEYFFVNNPLNRYDISDRNHLKKNEDGSVDLYIQNSSPGKDRESNWLPAPKDNFVLMLRMYWPEKSAIDGTWKPPAIKRVAS